MSRPLLVVLLLGAAGCATSSSFRSGERAERRSDFDTAVVEYGRAVKADPDKFDYRTALSRARLRASAEHQAAGRRLLIRGLHKEAIDELRLALDLNPASSTLPGELQEAEKLRQGQHRPTIDEVKDRTKERALPGLVLPHPEPLGLSFRDASLREAYLALGKAAGVNFVFDAGFVDQTISIDVKDVGFDQALNALGAAGKTFHRVVDAQVVQVVPDTPTKRREYEQQVVKTFFLSNADLKESIDLIRIVLGARRVAPLPGANALTMNDTPDKIAAAERILSMIDKKRAEVVVEVELVEVNRSKLKEYGIEITSGIAGTEGVVGAIFPNPLSQNTLGSSPYSQDNLVLTNLPGVIYRLLRTDGTTRLLANPQIRASEGQTAQARFGDQVPVPVTVFTPIASGGVSQQPVTSFEYKNVGVNIDITPRVHHDDEVTLNLKVDISSLGTPGYQGLPTFNSRQVTSVLRLKDGETSIMAGLISEAERSSMSGLPGLSSLPLLGRLFAHNKEEVTQSDIVLTLTPHVVRRAELSEEDLRSFTLGSETSPLLFEIPTATPSAAPRLDPPRVEPIRPPSPAPTPEPRS
jgi:general secretion pathway protein D